MLKSVMKDTCHNLIVNSIRFKSQFDSSRTLSQQLDENPQLKRLSKVNFEFQGDIGRRVGAVNVYAHHLHPDLRISIFHIPKGVTMKLHDHPKMHVITSILQGSMKATLYNRHPRKPELFVKQTKTLRKGDIHLTQQRIDNFHEFKAVDEKCSFLDIIFPDYNDTDRVCHYYQPSETEVIDGQQTYKLNKLAHDYHDEMVDI